MHDGQNLFDPHTAFAGNPWYADEVAERAVRAGRVPPLIIVGVANTPDRLDEYGPRREHAGDRDPARDYGRLLVEEVKPFIDATYRTRPEPEHTGVGGSSMGGLISLHLCRWYPAVFGRCAAMSPSLWWDREYFLRTAAESEWPDRCRVWLDVGERESSSPAGSAATMARTRRLADLFARQGLRSGEHFRYTEVPGGEHNEGSWGAASTGCWSSSSVRGRPTPPAPLPKGKGEQDTRSLPLAVGLQQAERSDTPSPFPLGRGAGGVGLRPALTTGSWR